MKTVPEAQPPGLSAQGTSEVRPSRAHRGQIPRELPPRDRGPCHGRTRRKGRLWELPRAGTVCLVPATARLAPADAQKMFAKQKQGFTEELAGQPSKDSYYARPGRYKGDKNAYQPCD